LALVSGSTALGSTVVRFVTNHGNVDVRMFDAEAPESVANFLDYSTADDYDGTFIHRSVANFIVQGGGYKLNGSINSVSEIPKNEKVMNEFGISNTAGTLAYAKIGPPTGEEPTEETINSATNEWFFNLADNSGNLNNQNGGFTVFGQVMGDHDVGRRAAMATSATRDAANREVFMRRATEALGVTPEVIDGEREGRLAYAGATADLADGRYVVSDIGGGSTEFVTEVDGVSIDIGSVRLSDRVLTDRPSPVLTTLGDERRYNPFFRYDDPELQQALKSKQAQTWDAQREMSESDAEATFRTTRALRNAW